jgi:hypothetical protein
MTAEDTYVLFLLAAFVLIMLITFARQIGDVWRGVALRYRLFEALLVVVGFLQSWILLRTDEALHLAAQAQRDAADTAARVRAITEATERAWIGPSTAARSEPFQAGQPARIRVVYNNTGRFLASFTVAVGGAAFVPQEQWTNGSAAADIHIYEEQCMRGLPGLQNLAQGVAYPTTGFSSYSIDYNSDNPNVPSARRLIVSDQIISERQIFVFYGCFLYHTGDGPTHHSFFCFFYQPLISEGDVLNFCPFGQRAD